MSCRAGDEGITQLALTDASILAPYLLPAPDLAAAMTAPKLMCHVHVSGDVTLTSSSYRCAPASSAATSAAASQIDQYLHGLPHSKLSRQI